MIRIAMVRTLFEVTYLALSSFLCDWYFFSLLAEETVYPAVSSER